MTREGSIFGFSLKLPQKGSIRERKNIWNQNFAFFLGTWVPDITYMALISPTFALSFTAKKEDRST